MSRAQTKKNISIEEFKQSMTGVFSTSVCQGTLDEAPEAYKPMAEIISQIEPTVKILTMVKPKLNIKDRGE